MGQVLHGCATTTEAVCRAIQHSQESLMVLATRYGINPKTVAKWRKRAHVTDARMGPKEVRSTVLSAEEEEEEAAVVAFHRHTLLPLDDCLYALQASIPHLTRSSLHRCLQRHGISRLPQFEESKTRSKFKQYPIGYFHIDIAEMRTEEGKLYLFVAIDRTSKRVAVAFLRSLIKAVPYKIHTILTNNGVQFCHPPRYRNGPTARFVTHMFDLCCREHGIEHRTTKVNHPWTNGQVERMNRTIKEATVKRYHYSSYDELKAHMQTFLMAYNFARRLKTLKVLTPFEYVCKIWSEDPDRFIINPHHHTVGQTPKHLGILRV